MSKPILSALCRAASAAAGNAPGDGAAWALLAAANEVHDVFNGTKAPTTTFPAAVAAVSAHLESSKRPKSTAAALELRVWALTLTDDATIRRQLTSAWAAAICDLPLFDFELGHVPAIQKSIEATAPVTPQTTFNFEQVCALAAHLVAAVGGRELVNLHFAGAGCGMQEVLACKLLQEAYRKHGTPWPFKTIEMSDGSELAAKQHPTEDTKPAPPGSMVTPNKPLGDLVRDGTVTASTVLCMIRPTPYVHASNGLADALATRGVTPAAVVVFGEPRVRAHLDADELAAMLRSPQPPLAKALTAVQVLRDQNPSDYCYRREFAPLPLQQSFVGAPSVVDGLSRCWQVYSRLPEVPSPPLTPDGVREMTRRHESIELLAEDARDILAVARRAVAALPGCPAALVRSMYE